MKGLSYINLCRETLLMLNIDVRVSAHRSEGNLPSVFSYLIFDFNAFFFLSHSHYFF
jgi:hypothetical protein